MISLIKSGGKDLGLVLLLALSIGQVANAAEVAVPWGAYQVVATRSASDVASTEGTDANLAWMGQVIHFDKKLQWLDGEVCEMWTAQEVDNGGPNLSDPILSDLSLQPSDTTSVNLSINMPVDLICLADGARTLARLTLVDSRTLVMASPSGARYFILERGLKLAEIEVMQQALADMDLYSGEVSGTLDKDTLAALSAYAERRGADYRFMRPAITETLLDGLGIVTVIQ